MFRFILLSGCALMCAAPLAARPAAAQANDATTSTTLPPVSVTAAPDGSLTVPSAAEQQRAVAQTPGGAAFVDSESYANSYGNNQRDVLKDVPGVFIQNRYGQELRLSVRGSGLGRAYHTRGIEILQDGIPTNLADGSGDFYQVDPMGLRWAEVFRGGNALPFGATTLGGAVNFVTPTAHTAVAPNILNLNGGSFGTIQGNFQVSRVLGDVDFLVGGTVSRSDGFRQHMRQQYEQFNANVGYRIGPNVETRFYAGVYITDQKMPGTLTLHQALNNPTRASASALSGDQARDVRAERIANRTTVTLENGRLDFDSWFIHHSLFHPIFMVLDYNSYTYGFSPRYTGTFRIGDMRNEVIVGGRLFGGNTGARWYFNNHGNRAGQSLDARQQAFNLDAFVENRLFFLPTLALVLGGKIYHANREYTDFGGLALSKAPYRTHSDRDYDGFNPKVGLLWEPRKDVQVFANVSRSADVPDFSDLTQFQPSGATGFVPLQAQRAWTLEAGTRGKVDRFGWDLTLYRSWVDGQLLQYTVDADIPASTFNAGRTILQGIELGASVDLARGVAAPGDQLTLGQLWNFSDFSFRGDSQYGNNALPLIPRHVLRTSLTYKHPTGFFIAPAVDWVPQGGWIDYANTKRVPSYALLGLRAGMRVTEGIDIHLDARNLTNKRYISDFGPVTKYSPATSTFYPGDGASVYVGLRARF